MTPDHHPYSLKPTLPKSLVTLPSLPAAKRMARPHRISESLFSVTLWSATMFPADVVFVPSGGRPATKSSVSVPVNPAERSTV